MVDCDDQLIDNAYEQALRDRAHAAYLAWSERHHTAWASGTFRYATFVATLRSVAFLPDGVRVEVRTAGEARQGRAGDGAGGLDRSRRAWQA